jgi:hypothetical protein
MVLASVSGCSREEKLEPVVPPVQTIVLSTTSEVPFRRFPGEVAAADTSNMSFDVPGRLIEFPAHRGWFTNSGNCSGALTKQILSPGSIPRAQILTMRTPNSPGGVNCTNVA